MACQVRSMVLQESDLNGAESQKQKCKNQCVSSCIETLTV